MKSFKKLLCAAGVALSMVGSAHAGAVLNNWVFNPIGTGFAAGTKVNEYLDVNGNAFIQLASTGGTGFSFTEHAVFSIVEADSKAATLFPVKYAGGNISAVFEGTGSGTLGGTFQFTSGTIKIYQNPTNGQYGMNDGPAGSVYGANLGNLIASFDVQVGGGGNVDGSGNPTGNGQVSVFAKASTPNGLAPGYFFRGNGNDLSNEDILSFAFTNANTIGAPDGDLVSEVACQFSGFTGPGCGSGTYANTVLGDVANNPSPADSHFFVSNNGQFKLAEVPEPGSLALFGIALLGAGVVSRKRKA